MSKSKAFTFVVCLLAFVSVLVPTSLMAQSQASSGQLAGAVKDTGGAVVPNASIEVVNLETGLKQTATTDAGGLYRVVLLPPGRYKVTATAQGFAPSSGEANVGVGRTVDVNLTLVVGARKEEITVSAEVIEATRHESAAFVNATVVSSIPLNGRRFHDIALLTPTAQVDPQRGQITLSGQRMVNTGSINVDGTDYGQLFFGGIRGGERAGFAPTIPLDSIQEFQIVRAGYTAEFGRSTGGVITAVTKSGSNDFHGSGGYVIRHESLARSNEFYDTVRAQLQPTCPTCVVNPNPTLMQWGGSFGGPIKRDRLFFFGSYDQQRQRLPHQVFFDKLATFTPTASTQEAYNQFKSLETPFQQTNDAWLFLIKGDYQISSKHRLSGRYNHSNYEGQNAVSVGSGLAPTLTAALSNNGTELDSTRTAVGQLTSYYTHFANEFRGQYARETRPRPANSLSPTVSNSIGAYGTSSFLGQNLEYDYRIQLADSVTWLKGAHTLKMGGEYNHIFATQAFGFNQFGQFNFTTSDTATILSLMGHVISPLNPTGNRFDSTSATYSRQIGNLQASLSGEQVAAFLQDSWRIRPNFTLNYGLRWEGAFNPTPAANNAMVPQVNGFTFPLGFVQNPGFIPNQPLQFAPRLGFAWDPFRDGKTIVRGFGGVYFAATPLLLYAGPVNNFREPPGDLSITLPITGFPASTVIPGCPNTATGNCNTLYKQLQIVGIDLNAFALDKLPIVTIDQIKTIAGTILTAQGKAFNPYNGAGPLFVSNTYHNPRSYQAGFGLERQISSNWTVAVEGSWIKTVFLERNTDLNQPLPVCTDAAGRPIYRLTGTAPTGCPAASTPRPIATLGSVQIRDSSAKALYRGLTVRSNINRKWGQFLAYYTFSESISDDDNERDSGGVSYVDTFNRAPEYSFSRLDRRHQFVATPVFFLPWKFEVSSSLRLLSGVPASATAGSDLNQDRVNNDRPYQAVGVPFKRNSYHDRGLTFIDLRIQKSVPIKEKMQVKISAEFFNLFNLLNLTYSGTTVTNFCSSTSVNTCGIPSFQGAAGGWTPNTKFLQLRDPATSLLLTNNAANGTPFQTQFSARFIF